MKKTLLLALALTCSQLATAQEFTYADLESDTMAVKDLVERFLAAAGDYDLET